MTDFNLRSHDGTTYLHYRPEPIYPFGFGLSYTQFLVKAPATTSGLSGSSVSIKVNVANIGSVSGAVALLAFVQREDVSHDFPLKRLGAFSKLNLEAGHSQAVTLTLPKAAFISVNNGGQQRIDSGMYVVRIRDATTIVELRGPSMLVDGPFATSTPPEVSEVIV